MCNYITHSQSAIEIIHLKPNSTPHYEAGKTIRGGWLRKIILNAKNLKENALSTQKHVPYIYNS